MHELCDAVVVRVEGDVVEGLRTRRSVLLDVGESVTVEVVLDRVDTSVAVEVDLGRIDDAVTVQIALGTVLAG